MKSEFSISGKPHEIQKLYNKFIILLSKINYVSDSYFKTQFLPRGTSEIEVLAKKGYMVSFFGVGLSVYSNFTTEFSRDCGKTLGKESNLRIKLESHDFSKLTKTASEIGYIDPVFEGNYHLIDEEKKDFLDIL